MADFRNTIKRHICIEYECCGMLMEEKINESHGLFNNAETIVDEIIAKATHEMQTKETFNISVDCFFAKLNIAFIVSHVDYKEKRVGKGGYRPAETAYNPSTGKLHNTNFLFYLKLYPEETLEHYRPLFYHELTHAYEDWNRRKNGKEDLYCYSERINYYKNDFSANEGTIWTAVKKTIYFLNDTEERAYIAMLKGIIDSGEPLYTAQQCYERIKKTKPYQFYVDVEKWIEEIKKCDNTLLQEKIIDYFRSHGFSKLKTFRGLCNAIDKRFFNFKEKIGKITGKIIFDYIEKLKTETQDWGIDYD